MSERRIPIGAVGANFEARPNVALDVAGQLLKSLNAAVLRTGGAALGTVTVLVDDVLRPALASAGLPPGAVGLVRSPDHEGARLLVSMPRLVPLVILRGSGETTAALARLAAENGVRTLAHAEGGGVLYVHSSASREKALALAEASLDRLGVCNRLNLALVDRDAADVVPALLDVFAAAGLEVRGTVDGALPLDAPLGHEWASDPERVRTVTVALVEGLDEAVRVANEETSGLAASIVAEDAEAAERFLDGYRGRPPSGTRRRASPTASSSRVRPRRGSTSTGRPGRGGRSRTATSGFASTASSAMVPSVGDPRRQAGTSLVAGPRGSVRRTVLRRRAREIAAIVAGGEAVVVVSSGAIALGLPHLGLERRPRAVPKLQAASALGQARLQQAWERALAREGIQAAQILLTAADVADRAAYVNARNALEALFALGAVPIVNENDATATDEIAFGDNDALAAQVAILVRARLLVLLTEVDGVYTRAPGRPDAELVQEGSAVDGAALGDASKLGRGGMRSKVLAARMAAEAGIPTVIADGAPRGRARADPRGRAAWDALPRREPRAVGVQALARFAKEPSGRLHLDDGARRAVEGERRSLLAVGVARCEGRFDAGDVVELVGSDGDVFAKGVASASADEIAQRAAGVEAVHRDRLVVY